MDHIHFSAYWNPSFEFDQLAPRGIKLWSRVLRDFANEPDEQQRFTLYGKITVTEGKWGFEPSEITDLNGIVQEQTLKETETHLYLYNTARIHEHPYIPKRLHVALIDAVLGEDQVNWDNPHVPTEFYNNVRKKKQRVRFWFRIKDIRPISLDEIGNLEGYYGDRGWEDFDDKNAVSPRKVRQKKKRDYFNPREVEKRNIRGWYELDLVSAISPKREQLEPGLFRSPAIMDLYAKALRYADSKIPVLILGERGTGKTVLAKFIRNVYVERNSPEKIGTKDWPQVACGEFKANPQLAQAQLLGYNKGAYTGATGSSEGLLKQADQDCIFMDEIANLPKETQRLLIKAIEEKEFQPLGSQKRIRSDFRLISATNQSIDDLESALDPDFMDRITYVVLKMPPLRDLLEEDLRMLWRHEYSRARHDFYAGREPDRSLGSTEEDDLIGELLEHTLPGNFRDLTRVAVEVLGVLNDSRATFSARKAVQEALGWRSKATVVPSHSDAAHVQQHQDPVLTFVYEHISKADNGGTLLKEINKFYRAWAEENGCKPMSSALLKKAIEKQLDIKSKHRKEGQFLPGVLLTITSDDSVTK